MIRRWSSGVRLSNESDTLLVSSAQSGDWSAYALLFQRHQPILRALCRRILADGSQVDDIVQEAALHAMLNLDRLHDKSRLGPWLCGVGLNLCRRWLRDRSRLLLADWSLEVLPGGRWTAVATAVGADPAVPTAASRTCDGH